MQPQRKGARIRRRLTQNKRPDTLECKWLAGRVMVLPHCGFNDRSQAMFEHWLSAAVCSRPIPSEYARAALTSSTSDCLSPPRKAQGPEAHGFLYARCARELNTTLRAGVSIDKQYESSQGTRLLSFEFALQRASDAVCTLNTLPSTRHVLTAPEFYSNTLVPGEKLTLRRGAAVYSGFASVVQMSIFSHRDEIQT